MAVNIWEGAKVDALIEAVTGNNQKLDRNQGAGNAGKALVVGPDGIVAFGNAGMSDNAKIALVNCFLHLGFLDGKGPELIEALQTALWADAKDTRIVYEIPHGTDISNWIIDTQQHAFTLDEDFTFLAKVTVDASGSETTGMFLLDSLSVTSPQVGARCQANISNGNITFRNVFNGGNTGSQSQGAGGTTTGTYLASAEHTIIMVLRNASKTLTVLTYVDGTLDYQEEKVCTDISNTYPSTYYIGKTHGNIERPWLGTVEIYRIYNVALSDSEIERLLNITM